MTYITKPWKTDSWFKGNKVRFCCIIAIMFNSSHVESSMFMPNFVVVFSFLKIQNDDVQNVWHNWERADEEEA